MLRDIQDRDVVGKLFDTIAPRFEARPGGYTRILRLGYRRGDSAEVAQIELVGSEFNPNAEAEKTEAAAKAKPKGVGGRLRAAAERLRGKKAEGARKAPRSDGREEGQAAARSKSDKGGQADTRGKGAKTSSAAEGRRLVDSCRAASSKAQMAKGRLASRVRPFRLIRCSRFDALRP